MRAAARELVGVEPTVEASSLVCASHTCLSLEDMLRTTRAAGRPKDIGDVAWLSGELTRRRKQTR